MIEIKRDVFSTQGKGAWLTVQIGSTAIYFGRSRRWTGPRIELFTPVARFRFSKAHRG